MERWVELRVHGVSGTPPESLLGVPQVEQVAGDDYSRFFRPAGAKDEGHVLEAYHWGRFTSGTWRQALALLLVPFGLVNAAQFMLPRPRKGVGELLFLLVGMCLRLLALVLTALLSFTLGLILIDIVAWRWAPGTVADKLPVHWIVLGGALAAVAGVVGLWFLGRSGRTRLPQDPSSPKASVNTALEPDFFKGEPNAPTMRRLHLAGGLTVIALLLALTRQAGDAANQTPVLPVFLLGLVALVVAMAGDPERTVTVGLTATAGSLWDRARPIIAWALLVGSIGLLIWEGWQTGHELSDLPRGAALPGPLTGFDHVANGLMVAAVVVLGVLHAANLSLVYRGAGIKQWTRRDARLRLHLLVAPLLVAVLILLVEEKPPLLTLAAAGVAAITVGLALPPLYRVLVAGTPGPPPDEFYFRPFAGGMTPFLLATLSTFLAVGLSAAAANVVAAALPDVDATTDMLDRVGYAWGLTAIELGLLALLGVALRWRVSHRFDSHVAADYAPPEGTEGPVLPEGWPRRVATAMTTAQGKNLLPPVVIVFVAVGLLISGVQVFETYPELGGVASWLGWVSEPREADGAPAIIGVGTWLLVGVAGYVVAVSRGAISNRDLRRAINVVWDVFSFWPHAVHPFVPRPYSRWTVIELRNRIRKHLDGPGKGQPAPDATEPRRRVVVAAHSQGSLIAYAALLLLEPDERKQVAFLSCGSQLRVIFPRAFPAYVNLETHRELFTSLNGAWINLYRLTDPLAGPVLSWDHTVGCSRHVPLPPGAAADDDFTGENRLRRCGNDWRLIDPIPHDADVETGPVAAIHGHHDFWGDPSWARALSELRTHDSSP